ncbi:MAG: tellurite methyltransferase [Planctomycetaceae bacterium]|jgi:tellurite methyltransferase
MLSKMSAADREKWNEKYSRQPSLADAQPDEWLIEACETIAHMTTDDEPRKRALDIACGLGHNSVWLAQHGWNVDGVDVSPSGLTLAQQHATELRCKVSWLEADLDDWQPAEDSYDLTIVFRFLDRVTVPRVVNAGLRSGGWLIYETFAAGQLDRPDGHIRNPAFTLAPGELPKLFPDFDVISFREDTFNDRTVQRTLARRQ